MHIMHGVSIGHSAALQDFLELISKQFLNPLVVYICGGHAHMPATARGCLMLVRSFLVQWEAPFAVKGFSSCIGRSVVTSSPFLATQHGCIWLHLSRLRQHIACAAGFPPAVMKATACVLVLAVCLAVAVQAQNFDRATHLFLVSLPSEDVRLHAFLFYLCKQKLLLRHV